MRELSHHQQILQMLTGTWITQALYVVARLGLADILWHGPRPVEDLASATGTDPKALYRLLRALASLGVFAEEDGRHFALTPLAECLRGDSPESQRPTAILAGKVFHKALGEMSYSVETGRPAFEKVYGRTYFEYLNGDPELSRLFDAMMGGIHGGETATILDAYSFSDVRVLADLGGGNGSVLEAALRKYPALNGILFDLPGVADRARARFQCADLTGRSSVVGGDFFEFVPDGADVYLLRHIIHDWDDESAIRILRNVRRVLRPGGKLLVIESVIAPGNEPSFGKLLDLAMLANVGGQERTEQEYDELFDASGFRLSRVIATRAEISVIEGERA
jgi:SAM-dependent methyltransferase